MQPALFLQNNQKISKKKLKEKKFSTVTNLHCFYLQAPLFCYIGIFKLWVLLCQFLQFSVSINDLCCGQSETLRHKNITPSQQTGVPTVYKGLYFSVLLCLTSNACGSICWYV